MEVQRSDDVHDGGISRYLRVTTLIVEPSRSIEFIY